jgi:hypothetical protein
MKTTIYFLVTAALIIFLYNGCGDDTVVDGGGNNNTADTSILRTDEFGNILYGDTTDWCYNSTGGGFRFQAAYPNPTNRTITAKFYIPENDTIKLYIKDSNGREHIYINGPQAAGTHEYLINDSLGEFLNTYQRLFITSKRYQSSVYCRFFGDIRFTE